MRDETPEPHDLSDILAGFQYEPGRVTARLVKAADGREVLQVRVELGVLQMECDGRPDGLQSVVAAGRGLGSSVAAAAARLEVAQVQQRAVAFLAVGDPGRAVRDADWILATLARLAAEAPVAEREWAESARFSVVVLRTRATVAAHLRMGRTREASGAVDDGLRRLHAEAVVLGIDDQFDQLADVRALRTLRESLVPQLPPAERGELEARLEVAVRAENYELAAILRDELRRL